MGVYDSLPVNPRLNGFRIYKLDKDGALYKGGVKELSDFLIPPDEVYDNNIAFTDWLANNKSEEISLTIYSLRTRIFTDIKIKRDKEKNMSLGASVKYENWSNADKKVLHVLAVKDGSFAKDVLQLVPMEEYIVAIEPTDSKIISTNSEEFDPLTVLANCCRDNLGKQCTFYIYNKKTGARNVVGKLGEEEDFQLGCDVGYGKIHEFPLDKEKNENDEEKQSLKQNAEVTPEDTKEEEKKEETKEEVKEEPQTIEEKVEVKIDEENRPREEPKKEEKKEEEAKKEEKKEEEAKKEEKKEENLTLLSDKIIK